MAKRKHNLNGLADELGTVRAKKADLENREKAIRKILIDSGVKILEDKLFRANLVETMREYIDWETIAERLEPSRQLVKAHTSHKPVISIRTTSRTGKAA